MCGFIGQNRMINLRVFSDRAPLLLSRNQFVMEYCGEVLSYKDFQERAERYDRENRRHYYFMTLRADEVMIFHFEQFCYTVL